MSQVMIENWKSLIKPSKILVEEKNGGNSATIVIQPLEKGFGLTLGNALRRVLLSSLQGFAVTSIKISGIVHEFGTIPGVVEDVIDIISNIKQLRINRSSPEICTIHLKTNKEGPVLANAIRTDGKLDIMNPELVICTLSAGASIEVEMKVEMGKGYRKADRLADDESEKIIGEIAIDAFFSPVRKVNYSVEDARVGQSIGYDKLILDIDTNGAVSPQDAIALAAKILQDQLQSFINFDAIEDRVEKKTLNNDFNYNLLKTIDELELSVRSYNCLKNDNVVYIGDLVRKTEAEMLRTSNFGRKSLNELKEVLKIMGLSFGMELKVWPPKNIDEMRAAMSSDNSSY